MIGKVTTAVLAFTLSVCGLASAQTCVQATSIANVRTGPGTGYTVIGQVPSGNSYVAASKSGDWWKIYFDGRSGYTYGPLYRTLSGTTGVKVTADLMNVRSGPGTGYTILGKATMGEIFYWTQYAGLNGWYKVNWGGRTAYLNGGFVVRVSLPGGSTTPPPPPTEPPPADDGSTSSASASPDSGQGGAPAGDGSASSTTP